MYWTTVGPSCQARLGSLLSQIIRLQTNKDRMGLAQTASLNFSVVFFFEQLCLLLLLKYLKISDRQMQDGNFSPTREKMNRKKTSNPNPLTPL